MKNLLLVSKDTVVSFHYTLKNGDGEVLDSSQGGDPLSYLHGYEQIVLGLEKALVGKTVGATLNVVVAPEEGYGPRREDLVITVPREQWTLPDTVGIDEIVELQSDEGQSLPARIVDMQPDCIMLDANHPLAGVVLHFDVELTEVRPATDDELSHGHVHGPGGHEH